MKGKSRKVKLAALLMVISMVSLLAGCSKSQEAAVWGRVDSKEVDINSKIPGRVVEVLVKEGEAVKKGQLLARIENTELKAKVEQAKAASAAAQALVSQAGTATTLQERTTQAALASAQTQLNKAAADLELARKNYERYKALNSAGAVSAMVLDEAKLRYDAAAANYAQAQAALESAKANLLQEQLGRDNEAASAGKLAQAEAALAEVQALLADTEIRAPIDGIVTSRMVEQGEMVSTGTPLMTIQDPLDNWVNVKVKETDLSKYTLNAQVTLQGQDKNLKLTGTIVDISRKPEFAAYKATNERGELDVTTYNVKIQLNSDQVRPGMRLQVVGGGQ